MSFRNLEVPYFSQRMNQYVWQEKYSRKNKLVQTNPKLEGTIVPNGKTDTKAKNSCNITCLAMILHYYGITSDTPDEMMRKVFNPTTKELNVYTDAQKELVSDSYTDSALFEKIENMKKFSKNFYNVESEVKYWKTFDEIKNDILAGFPVLVSVGLLHEYDESCYKSDLESDKGIEDIKNFAYHLYADINLSKVKKGDFDKKNTELENKKKILEENLKKENLAETEKKQYEKELTAVNQELDKLKECKTKGYQYCLDVLRSHGHFVVIRGVDDSGVIINDPWGKPVINNKGKGEYFTIMNGDNIHLNQKDFDKQYFTDTHFWSSLIIREKKWNFVSRKKDFLVTNEKFFENCRKAEMFEFGGYPIKRSNLWHNGLHFNSSIGKEIYPIGPGQLVAARIVNKDSSGNLPANGSRCFVLIKHQILDDEKKLKDFFVCYMHLNPLDDLEKIINSGSKTNIFWLDELIKRTKSVRQIKYGKDDTSFYLCDDKEGKKAIGQIPNSGLFLVDLVDDKNKKIYFYYEVDNEIKKCWVNYSSSILTRSDNKDIYIRKLDELKSGNVVFFNDKDLQAVDTMIEVSNSHPIGFMGKYGGYGEELKETLHFEIFSNDILIKNKSEFTIIKENELPSSINNYSAMCKRKEMISFFEDKKLYGTFDFEFLNRDGIITKSEMMNFYNSINGAKKFQNYVIQHISEWSDKIDWVQALENSTGVSKKGLGELIKYYLNDESSESLENYVKKIYEPYKWFDSKCITAMNTESSFFNKGYATFYHPIQFIKWLNDNKK